MDIENIHEKPPYAMIAILFIGAFVALLNNTLLNVAIPTIMVEFDVSLSTVQWTTTGYMLINGILIPASVFFIQKFTNNRRLFLVAHYFSLERFLQCLLPQSACLS